MATMPTTGFGAAIAPVYTNLVRQDVKQFTMQDLAFGQTAVDKIEADVTGKLGQFIARNHMPVQLLSVTIGRAAPPQEILDQRTRTAEQQQRMQTELAGQKAEEARKGRELARAEADNAYRVQMQWTPEQLIETKRIDMLKEACSRGTCIFGGGTPIINTNH
jgi:regulator of protease activity HflC (stomatin/prohibitin superfamily)